MTKKIIFSVLAVIVIGGVIYLAQRPAPTPEYLTHRVERGRLEQTVDATGKIESAEKVELNFKITGRISEILANPGQQVTTGSKLASLDTGALRSQVSDAQAQLARAQADYQKLLAGASAEDIKIAEDTVEQKKQTISTAENELANLIVSRDIELTNLKEAAIVSLNNELITAQGAMEEVRNTLDDDDAEATLAARDRLALVQTLSLEGAANLSLDQSEATINLVSILSSDTTILDALEDLRTTLDSVATTLSNTLDVLAATIVSKNLTEAELDALKNNIKSQQIKINTSQSNIQNDKAAWTNKQVYYQDQYTSLQDKIKQAKSDLQIAESQLALKQTPPRSFEIDASRAQVDQARAAVNLAQARLDEAVINAPLDGTITKKNYEVGEQTSLSQPVLEMIGQSNLQIEVDIPESDIAKVIAGQLTNITLDAFGDSEVFTGQVTFVDPAETLIQDVVYYKVKVMFNEFDNKKKPGMTANVTILTTTKDNVLWVPSRAIKNRDGERYVEILDGDIVREQVVTLGLPGDQGVEILTGLQAGDEVITFVKEK